MSIAFFKFVKNAQKKYMLLISVFVYNYYKVNARKSKMYIFFTYTERERTKGA